MKILLAMSGGIDSSTLAYLLKDQGHEVIGVRFTLWSDPLAPALAQVLPTKCCSTQNIARASRVAKTLGIPLHILDLEDEFKRTVVDPYLEAHAQGLTPNPCIGCNRSIKFGKLLKTAEAFGCDALATGHYARVASERLADGTERAVLLEAIDHRKDQSYYLYGLTQEQLKKTLFPLGGMTKDQVYALAEHYGMQMPDTYRESQDLCFFPERTPQEFLKRHLKNLLKPGSITRRDGSVVGSHSGLPLYTIGQRRGLRIGGLKIPLEVVAKDTTDNRLIVAEQGEERTESVNLIDLRFVSWMPEQNASIPFECRVRSLSVRLPGQLKIEGANATFTFKHPQPPQTPGQSLVLYRGEEVIGGGVIA